MLNQKVTSPNELRAIACHIRAICSDSSFAMQRFCKIISRLNEIDGKNKPYIALVEKYGNVKLTVEEFYEMQENYAKRLEAVADEIEASEKSLRIPPSWQWQ